MHIPDDPLYYEKFYFTPGDLGFRRFDTRFGRIGVCVCWDQWYPEAARLTALAGAQILFYPDGHRLAARREGRVRREPALGLGNDDAQPRDRQRRVRGRGQSHGQRRASSSSGARRSLADPNGNVLARAAHDEEETLLVECDLDQIDVVRTHWPFLRDRRIDAYGDLTKRYLD